MAREYLPTPLTDAFFSDFNCEYLHDQIIKSVQARTGYTIGRQNDSDLRALMGRVFTDLRADPYTNVRSQVAAMNSKVVAEANETIAVGLLQNIVYQRDFNTLPVPLAAPSSTSTYGNKIPINNKFAM